MTVPRPPRYVVARRYAVPWLLQLGLQGQARRAADHARLAGRSDVADDLDEFAAQLRDTRAPISVIGNAETTETETGRQLERPSSLGIPTATAAGLLGVTARQVINYLEAGTLSGTKVGGRWMVDRRSVEEYKQLRSLR